jgi:hypothetical protein
MAGQPESSSQARLVVTLHIIEYSLKPATVAQRPVLSRTSLVEEHSGMIASIIASKGESSPLTYLESSSDLASCGIGNDGKVLEATDKLLSEMKIPMVVLTGRTPFKAR